MNNSKQPRDFDVVLGGEAAPPVSGIVLGGLEGVKNRLKSSNIEARIAALSDALNYGNAGLDMVIQALQDSSQYVQHSAGRLLKEKGGVKGKQAVLSYDPWLYFTKFEDWNVEHFDPKIGITSPVSSAYIVELQPDYTEYKLFELDKFKTFLKDPQVSNVEALICQGWHGFYSSNLIKGCSRSIKMLIDVREQLSNIKALFIGDDQQREYMKSYLELGNITPILSAYPKLEILQLRGYLSGRTENIDKFRITQHNNLKTLIIETACIEDTAIAQISEVCMPTLEYLELWFGRSSKYCVDKVIDSLLPLFSSELTPNLIYLGLRSCDWANEIAYYITESPIIEKLKILDLSMGSLTDEGASILLNCPGVNKLHTLNISNNCISSEMVEKISQLKCRVIADSQGEMAEGISASRYWALYE